MSVSRGRPLFMCLLLILLWWTNSKGQEKGIDSLIARIESLEQTPGYQKDTVYIMSLYDLAFSYYSYKPDSTIALCQKVVELSKAINYNTGTIIGLRGIGLGNFSKGLYAQAYINYMKALDLAKSVNHQAYICKIYSSLGLYYHFIGEYAKSLENHLMALQLSEALADRNSTAASLLNISAIYLQTKQYDLALFNLDRALVVASEIKSKYGIATILNNKADINFALHRLEEALQNNQQALSIREEIQDVHGIASSICNIGRIYTEQGKTEEAKMLLLKSLRIREQTKDKNGIILSMLALSNNEESVKNYFKAIEYANKALTIASEIGQRAEIRDSHEMLSGLYEKEGNSAKALKHFKLFKICADSLSNIERDRKMTLLSAQAEYDRKEQVMRAEQDKKNEAFETENLQQRWIIISVSVICLLALFSGFLIHKSNRRIKQAYKQLEQAHVEISIKSRDFQKLNEQLENQQRELAEQNEALRQSKEEISAQHDLVAEQNNELLLARKTIEHQNHEIRLRNEDLELKVENRTKELAEYIQQLEQFAFITAHNLRGPVARILGLSNVFDLIDPSSPDSAVIVSKIKSTTKELDNVVKDIATILTINKNHTAVFTRVAWEDSFNAVRKILDWEITATNAKIETDFTNAPTVSAVKEYVDSILLNLLGNAIKYRHPEREPVIKIMTMRIATGSRLIISDNGLGLDTEKHKERLFTLYGRFHSHVEGKGLGLFLVKTQTEAMGGKILLTSTEGEGMRITIELKG